MQLVSIISCSASNEAITKGSIITLYWPWVVLLLEPVCIVARSHSKITILDTVNKKEPGARLETIAEYSCPSGSKLCSQASPESVFSF